MYFNY